MDYKVRFVGEDSNLSNASKSAAASLERVNKVSQQVSAALKTQTTVSQQASAAAARLAQTAAQSGGTVSKTTTNFTGLSRVIQDLPFGFTAISNNLTQVLPAAGAAGLAISAFTSALVFAQTGFGAWTRGMGGIFGANKQLISSLAITNDAIKEAADNVGKEVVQLSIFKQKLNDVNIPAKERVQVLEEYNKVADRSNQIDVKQINNLDLINQKIEAQNSLIVKRALSLAAMSKLSETANKLIEDEVKLQEKLSTRGFKDLDDYTKKQKQAADDRLNLFKKNPNAFKQQENLNQVRKGLDGVVNPALKAANAFNRDEKEFSILIDSVKKGRAEFQKLAENLSGLITVPGLTTKDEGAGKGKKGNDDFKKELEAKKQILLEFVKDFDALKVPVPKLSMDLEEFDKSGLTKELRQQLNAALIGALKGPEIAGDKIINDPLKFKVPAQPTIDMKPPDKKEVDAQLKKLGDQLSAAFTNFFQSSFEGLGSSIGEGIASGSNVAEIAVESIGETMAALIQQIGKSLIEYGIVKSKLDAILSGGIAIPGAVAIAAGVGAIAISQLIRSSFKDLPGHATGLWNVPMDDYVARLHRNEMVLPASVAEQIRDSGMLSRSFNINAPSYPTRGQITANAGGSAAVATNRSSIPSRIELTARGKDLKAVIVTTEKSQGRAT